LQNKLILKGMAIGQYDFSYDIKNHYIYTYYTICKRNLSYKTTVYRMPDEYHLDIKQTFESQKDIVIKQLY